MKQPNDDGMSLRRYVLTIAVILALYVGALALLGGPHGCPYVPDEGYQTCGGR